MPTDVQIVASQVEAAPLEYVVPGSAEFLLKAVSATFTDNGASVDWLPAVELVSDSGHRITLAIDRGAKVPAGDDAEVSWFPGVKSAAAATGPSLAGVKFAYTTMAPTTVTAGFGKVVPLDSAYFVTNDATVWAQSGFNDVTFNAVGRYLCGISWKIVAPGLFATTFPGEMAVNKQPGFPTTFGFLDQFNVASTATSQMQEYQWQGFTIDGSTYPTGQPLEYRFVNHTAVTLDLYAAVFMVQLDTNTALLH